MNALQHIEELTALLSKEKNYLAENAANLAEKMAETLKNGGKILLMGNGGSAADAQHIAAEFVVRYKLNRRALAAIALTTDTSVLTAIGNDFSFDELFARQVQALANRGDMVIGLSTSGNSKNIILGLEAAKKCGCYTVAFLGNGGGALKGKTDMQIIVNSANTPRIQECHIAVAHIACELAEIAAAQ